MVSDPRRLHYYRFYKYDDGDVENKKKTEIHRRFRSLMCILSKAYWSNCHSNTSKARGDDLNRKDENRKSRRSFVTMIRRECATQFAKRQMLSNEHWTKQKKKEKT